jgi:opacity protein-like surface antigen
MAMFTVLILWLGSVSSADAQQIQVGIDFATVAPRGSFSENVTNNGYGVGGQFLVGLGRSPFHLGVDAAFTNYGSDEHEEPLSTTIPEVDIKVRTDNNIILTHLLLRAQPRSGRVRPYADGLVGLKYLFTRTSINNEFDEEIASTTNLSDTTLSYGFGGGLQVRLANIGSGGDVSFDTKVRYLRGSHAEYLKKGSIRRENGSVSFDVLSSRTDVLTVQVGVTFRF